MLKVVQDIPAPVAAVEASHLSSHRAVYFNYPEFADQCHITIGISSDFIDFSVMKDQTPVYYNWFNYEFPTEINHLCISEIQNITGNYYSDTSAVFLYGEGLTKQILDNLKSQLNGLGDSTFRLNPFRMMSTQLSRRLQDYCIRTAHLYPPCIGGMLPINYKRFIV